MNRRDRILASILEAIEEIRDTLPPEANLGTAPSAALLDGQGGPLDSLGVVNLMVALESRLESEFERPVSLAAALAVPPDESPFRNIALLADYLEGVVDDAQ